MEKAKIRTLATPKPLNRSSQKLAAVITSWTAPGMQNLVAIGSGVSVPQIRDFAVYFLPIKWLNLCRSAMKVTKLIGKLGSVISKIWTIFAPVRGHVRRRMRNDCFR